MNKTNLIDYNICIKDHRSKFNKHSLIINNKCNFDCIYCLAKDKKKEYVEDSKKTYKKIDACTEGSFIFFNSYGETTLSPHLLDYVKYAKNKNKFRYIGVATNGTRLSNFDFAYDLINAGVTNMLFSFYSSDERIFTKTCGVKGAFENSLKALENLKKLKEKFDFHITINIVVTMLNYKSLKDTFLFLKKYNIDRIRLTKFAPLGNAFQNFEKLMVKKDLKKHLKQAVDTAVKENIVLKMQFPIKDVDFLDNPSKFLIPFRETLQIWTIHCVAELCPSYDKSIPNINSKCNDCSLNMLCMNYSNLLKSRKEIIKRNSEKYMESAIKVIINKNNIDKILKKLEKKSFKKDIKTVKLNIKDIEELNFPELKEKIKKLIQIINKKNITVFSTIPYCYLDDPGLDYKHYKKINKEKEMKKAIKNLLYTTSIIGTDCNRCKFYKKCSGIPLLYFYNLGFPLQFGEFKEFQKY